MSDDKPPPQPLSAIEAAIDPRWQIGGITLDGATHILLTLHHPRHGEIHSILPRLSAAEMRDVLIRALAD